MKERGLYIHIPFCKSKCYYCDFYSVNYSMEQVEKYLYSLEQEIIYLQNKYEILNSIICTIYVGGGTPSVLSENQFFSLFKLVAKYFNVKSVKEITVEVNPESITEQKLYAIKNATADMKTANLRISVGVQSFNENILKLLGRRHTNADVYKLVETLTKVGISNYNFDLIFGCPGQSISEVELDLKKVLSLAPQHISYYALTIEPDTVFYFKNISVNEDLQADMYKKIVDTLTYAGYHHYEISNFAIPGYECLHNLNYWFYKEYIGLGPSSVSFLYPLRIKNESVINEYLTLHFKYSIEEIDYQKAVVEKIMLALRTNFGIRTDELEEIADKSIINDLISKHKLTIENNYYKISPKYWFLSNSVIKELIFNINP